VATAGGGGWKVVDEGPPEQMGATGKPSGHYVGKDYDSPDEAVAAAERLADDTGHVTRVVKTFWPERR
jgi:hypothetical protein